MHSKAPGVLRNFSKKSVSLRFLIVLVFFFLFAGSVFAQTCVDMPTLLGYIGEWKTGLMDMPTLLGYIGDWKTGTGCTGQLQMTTASRTTGVMPLAVFFDAVDETDWPSGVVQPRGFANQLVQITGVKITTVGFSNALGNGTLSFNAANKTLQWNSGAAVPVSLGKNFALQSGSSQGKLSVWVDPSLLPATNISEQIQIVNGGINADWTAFHYEWDFGDPPPLGTSPTDSLWFWEQGAKKSDGSWFEKNREFGWNAAHVYENAGADKTYTVRLRLITDEGSEYNYLQTITVAAQPATGWTTYYFAASGLDSNPCSDSQPCQTWDKAIMLAGANVKLLFKRGDEFNATRAIALRSNEPFYLGAYGTGEKPIIRQADNNSVVLAGNLPELRVVDLDVQNNTSTEFMAFQYLGNGALMLRIRLYQTGQNNGWNQLAFVVDTEFENVSRHTIYHEYADGRIKRMAILGSDFLGPGEHDGEALNRFYSSKLVVEHNNYAHQPISKAQMRLISGRWKIVSFNHFSDADFSGTITLEADQANTGSVNHAWIVGNEFDFRNSSYLSPGAIKVVGGKDILIAANRRITNQSGGFVTLQNYLDTLVELENVHVLGNSAAGSSSLWTRFFDVRPDYLTRDYGIVVANNAFFAPNTSDMPNTYSVATGYDVSTNFKLLSNYNMFFTPLILTPFKNNVTRLNLTQWQLLGQDKQSTAQNPMFVDAANGDLRLSSSSPAKDAGTNEFLAWNRIDADGKYRTDGNPDIGAFEYP